jgi:hypothetical protein
MPYQGYTNWIISLRGCSVIFRQAVPYIEAGPLGYLMSDNHINGIIAAGERVLPPNEDDKSLTNLIENLLTSPVVKSSTTVEEMEAYAHAITELKKLLIGTLPPTTGEQKRFMASLWSYIVNDTFLRLVGEKRPTALIIMAHYAILMKKCEESWYVSDRAEHMFETLMYDLTEEWLPFIEHPMNVFGFVSSRQRSESSASSNVHATQESLLSPFSTSSISG